jgi:hypothetical protein
MKNKISDLRNHLFEQLERLNDNELSDDKMKIEIERATAMSNIGKVIVESAKVQVDAMRIFGYHDTVKDIIDAVDYFTEATARGKRDEVDSANDSDKKTSFTYVPEGQLTLTGK